MIFQMGATQQKQITEAIEDHGLDACLAIDQAAMDSADKIMIPASLLRGTKQAVNEFRRAARLTPFSGRAPCSQA